MIAKQLRRILSPNIKRYLGSIFPEIYKLYERSFVLNTLGLKKYYNKKSDSLMIGKSVLPMNIICDSKLLGVFNSEFVDIVYPMLPNIDEEKVDFNEGPYELGNVQVNKGDIVFDCGANIGLFSLMAFSRDCTCFAFEPLPENISFLNKIIQLNQNIILAPYALSDQNATMQFSNDKGTTSNKIISSNNHENTITVNCITLDSFVENNGINKVDFIKADIEGAERLLLKGAKNVLKEFAPKISICTYHLPDDPQVLRELILDSNPKYKIEEKYKKMYAYVPK